jgi:uncharacterized protein YcfJ
MKAIFASACLLALTSFAPAEAKGCIKGAIVGGVAGHMAGHGKLGAAGGCVVGHHEANKPNPNDAKRTDPVRAEVADRTTPLSQPTRNAP